jgi:hypothetical protein
MAVRLCFDDCATQVTPHTDMRSRRGNLPKNNPYIRACAAVHAHSVLSIS